MKIKHPVINFLLLFFLVFGLTAALALTRQSQDIRGRSAGTDTPHVKPLNADPVTSTKQFYASPLYGYSVNYDKNYWTETNGSLEGKNDLKELSFTLNGQHGMADVTFVAHDEKELTAALSKGKSSSGKDDLDTLASYVSTVKKTLPGGVKLASTERVTKNGRAAYRLTFEKQFLKDTIESYEYLFLENKKYYEISTKYLPGPSTDLAESFVDAFLFSTEPAKTVQGIEDIEELNSAKLDETEVVELTNPSVVNIANVTCPEIRLKGPQKRYMQQSYSYCAASKGSGFIVTKEGHIATNGHVAKIYPEKAFLSALPALYTDAYPHLNAFLTDLYRLEYYEEYKEEVSEEEAKEVMNSFDGKWWASDILDYLIENNELEFKEGESKYFIKLGNEPLAWDKDKLKKGDFFNAIKDAKDIREATLVAYDFPNNATFDILLEKKQETPGADVAILKLKNDENFSYPNLQLGDVKKVKEGNSLLIIGYPGLVEGVASSSSLLSFQSSAKSTITRGIVSSIKTDQDGRTLIQTDASIDNGNSGGPAFDKNGNVVGIATYGMLSVSGNYNILRSIDELKALMKKNDISAEDTSVYTNWYTGLNYFWDGYYRKAARSFESVKAVYPRHPSVASYLDEAQAAIKDGKDKGGTFDAVTDVIPLPALIGLPLLLILAGAGGFLYFKKRGTSGSGGGSNTKSLNVLDLQYKPAQAQTPPQPAPQPVNPPQPPAV